MTGIMPNSVQQRRRLPLESPFRTCGRMFCLLFQMDQEEVYYCSFVQNDVMLMSPEWHGNHLICLVAISWILDMISTKVLETSRERCDGFFCGHNNVSEEAYSKALEGCLTGKVFIVEWSCLEMKRLQQQGIPQTLFCSISSFLIVAVDPPKKDSQDAA
jgi:hypothetical protein